MSYIKYNDYELIYMVRENDDNSYDALFNKYLPIIKRISYEHYKNFKGYGYDYEDFLQEGFLSFQKALSIYNPDKDCLFYTFLVLCINRGLITFCKRISCSKKNINNNNFIDIDDAFVVGDTFVDSSFISLEKIQNIWEIVYEFDLPYICVFELRFNGFSFKEIEMLLDIPIRRAQFIYNKVNKIIRSKMNLSM